MNCKSVEISNRKRVLMKINKKYLVGPGGSFDFKCLFYELGLYQVERLRKIIVFPYRWKTSDAKREFDLMRLASEGINAEQIVIKIMTIAMSLHMATTIIITMVRFLMMRFSVKNYQEDPNYKLKMRILGTRSRWICYQGRWKILCYLKDAAHADNVRTKKRKSIDKNKNIVNIVKVDPRNDGAASWHVRKDAAILQMMVGLNASIS